jgi:hypothetical protein
VRNQETPHNTEGLPLFFGEGGTIGQAAQRAPQKTTDPALAGSVRTRCPRTHNWQLVRPPESPPHPHTPTL